MPFSELLMKNAIWRRPHWSDRNNDRYWHLQSYFWRSKAAPIFLTFRKFVNGIVSYEDKVDVIYEPIPLAPTLKAAGLDCQALFPVPMMAIILLCIGNKSAVSFSIRKSGGRSWSVPT
jgi:hypothetical protein